LSWRRALAAGLLGVLASAAGGLHPRAVGAPEARVDPAAAGWDAAALAEVVAYVAAQRSTGFVVIDRNRIIADYTWPLAADAAVFEASFVHGKSAAGAWLEDVASQQKSVVALLAGIAVDLGCLDVSQPVSTYVPAGWSKAASEHEAKITVRHLLKMNSGLKEDLSVDAPPGTKFYYNTPAYAVLKPVLEGAAKKSLDELTREWLTGPADLRDTSWRRRPGDRAAIANPTGLVTTPRDLARLGQLVLAGGRAASGRPVISEQQLALLFRRSTTNPAYGRLWWLNGSDAVLLPGANATRARGPLIPAAPSDLVAAQGAEDRKLYVVPSRQWVVVRTGRAAPDGRAFNQKLWTLLMKAAPAPRPGPP
jgi:CubicO group peptidase (beta-lactamase class C family)